MHGLSEGRPSRLDQPKQKGSCFSVEILIIDEDIAVRLRVNKATAGNTTYRVIISSSHFKFYAPKVVPRYIVNNPDQNCDRDNGDAFSAAVNKFVEDHGLRESERHTLYSLRHGFNDRLRESEAPDELKDEWMGYDTKKPRYGDEHGLRLKLKYIERIALAPGMQVATPLQLVVESARSYAGHHPAQSLGIRLWPRSKPVNQP
jgi:hypothetical protein